MKRCEKCGVLVPSSRNRCPLCQRLLLESDEKGFDSEIFPYIPTIYHRHNLLIRISLFCSIVLYVVCLALNLLVWKENWWSLFVLAGEAAGWMTVAQAIRKRSTFCKHVLYQIVTISAFAVLFDAMTGFHRWSFQYVIPALCALCMIVVAIIAVVGHREIENYIIYMVVSALFGMIPILFWLFHWSHILWPSLLTFAGSIIYLAGLLILGGKDTIAELRRRLHL